MMGDVIDLAHERARRRNPVEAFVASARTAGLDTFANFTSDGQGWPVGAGRTHPHVLAPEPIRGASTAMFIFDEAASLCRHPGCPRPAISDTCLEHRGPTERF